MYTVLFRHPLVGAITTWDFNDGCWLGAPSGFVRQDNSEKPSYRKLNSLIHGEWETHTTVTTDAEGWAVMEGFRGGYTLKGTDGEAKICLTENKETEIRLEK